MTNIIPQVDYQSRDFASIRDDMVNLIPNFAPQWTSRDSADFGMVLIDLFAYMGDMLSYYIDRAANEAFISTATQRETVLGLARLLGYTPTEPSRAQHSITVTNASSVATAYVNQYATFATDEDEDGVQIFFEYTGTTATVAPSSTTSITVYEGTRINTDQQIGVSDGTANQTFVINEDVYVYASTLTITVNTTPYTKVDNLVDYGPTDRYFSTYYDGNNVLTVMFGDGASGFIPPLNSTIKAKYVKGRGSKGNVGASTIVNVLSNSPGTTADFTVTNTSKTPIVSGSDPESTTSIRINAPKSLRALDRAVALVDYSNLVKRKYSTVAKANAVADGLSSVILFVMGNNWGTGFTSSTLSDIKSYFVDKTPPNTVVTVLNGTVVYPAVAVSVTAIPTANNDDIKAKVKSALSTLFAFENVDFNDVFYQGDIDQAIRSISGVNTLTITGFERRTASTTTAATTANPAVYFYVNEVPKYDEDNMSITVTGGTS